MQVRVHGTGGVKVLLLQQACDMGDMRWISVRKDTLYVVADEMILSGNTLSRRFACNADMTSVPASDCEWISDVPPDVYSVRYAHAKAPCD